MSQTLYDDTYTGPRWRYGFQHRPISTYLTPRDDMPAAIVLSWRESSDQRYPHGTADWPVELAPDVARHYSLVPVSSPTLIEPRA